MAVEVELAVARGEGRCAAVGRGGETVVVMLVDCPSKHGPKKVVGGGC